MKHDAILFKSDKEKQKTIQTFQQLQKTLFFDEYFWPINEIERHLNELNEKAPNNSVQQKMQQLERDILSNQQQIVNEKNEQESIQKRMNPLRVRQQNEQEKLTLALGAALSESVELVI